MPNAFSNIFNRIPPGQSAEQYVQSRVLDPSIVERGTLVPFGINRRGGKEIAAPQFIVDLLTAIATAANPGSATPEGVSNLASNVTTGGLLSGSAPAGSLGMFVGRRTGGKSARDKIDSAKKMMEYGIDFDTGQKVTPELIRQKTGVSIGADGKMRVEIDDSGAKLKTDELGFGKKLFDVLEHPDIHKHESLASINVKGNPVMQGLGVFDRKSNTILIGPKGKFKNNDEILSTLLHEVQHSVQALEGFARGGNPKSFKDGGTKFNPEDLMFLKRLVAIGKAAREKGADPIEMIKRNAAVLGNEKAEKFIKRGLTGEQIMSLTDKIDDRIAAPIEQYRRLAGEVEARNVQTRRNMTAAERRATSPESTEDLPRSKQKVVGAK